MQSNPPLVGRRHISIGQNQNQQNKIENDHYSRREPPKEVNTPKKVRGRSASRNS
jgi:hypothetical protein